MNRTARLTTAVLACALAAPLGAFAAAPATAAPAAEKPSVTPVQTVKNTLADELQDAMSDERARAKLVKTLAIKGEADILTILDADTDKGDKFSRKAQSLNITLKNAKGLGKFGGSAMKVRLVNPATKAKLGGPTTVFAASPAEDDVTVIAGTNLGGDKVKVDLTTEPDYPLVLVELDTTKVMAAASATFAEEFVQLGGESAVLPDADDAASAAKSAAALPATKIVTKLDTIKLKNDQEPWFKGGAEIYGIVMGQGKDGKARADIVGMPYLNYSGTTYSPGQGIIDWSNFKWNNVDFLLMEQDDNTNYKDLAKAVAGAIATLAGGAAYVPLINAVLSAIPSSWLTDDDDYVDSFYMLAKNSTGVKWGASSNARATIHPVVVTTA